MRIDKGKVSGARFMFTLVCFVKASALLIAFLYGVVRHDSLYVVIIGIALCLPLIWIFRTLMVMFPDLNLLQVLEKVYGRFLGKLFGLIYLWFFLTLSALNLGDLGKLSTLTIMEEASPVVLMIMCILVTTLAVRNGIKTVTWYSALLMTVSFFILIVSILMVLNQLKFDDFLPIMNLPVKKYVQGVHIISTIPIGELVVFLMITPNIQMSRKEAKKYVFGGFLLGGLTVMLTAFRDIAVLGNTIGLFEMPQLVTMRSIRIGESLSRMDLLFNVALISQLSFKVMFLHYVFVIAVAQILNVKAFRHLALAAGSLIIAYSLSLYSNSVEHIASAREYTPFLWMFFEMLIPLVTLVIAKLRKLPVKKEA